MNVFLTVARRRDETDFEILLTQSSLIFAKPLIKYNFLLHRRKDKTQYLCIRHLIYGHT